jgi:hypothetical protein
LGIFGRNFIIASETGKPYLIIVSGLILTKVLRLRTGISKKRQKNLKKDKKDKKAAPERDTIIL